MLFEWMGRSERQYVSEVVTQVYLELSTACNLSCTTCVRNSIEGFSPRHFSRQLMKRFIRQARTLHSLQRVVLLGFGEALCNPDLNWHIEQLSRLDVDIYLVTNGLMLDKATAQMLVDIPVHAVYVSIDDLAGTRPLIRKGTGSDDAGRAVDLLADCKARTGNTLPVIGVETVATKSNVKDIPRIIRHAGSLGAEEFIVTNLFPYDGSMKDEILYTVDGKNSTDLEKLLKKERRVFPIRTGNNRADVLRRCPFIERGTLFVTSEGTVAPCPELAYTHPAWYFGSPRLHKRYELGHLQRTSLMRIWEEEEFATFRDEFSYYQFPDCSICFEPDMCYHRTEQHQDCFSHETPCGECLWAKDIVICP